jgi:nitrate reductase beta subunit
MNQHCSLDYPGGGGDSGAHVEDTLAENFHLMAQPAGGGGDAGSGTTFRDDDGRARFNLLGWNGTDPAPGLFPDGAES